MFSEGGLYLLLDINVGCPLKNVYALLMSHFGRPQFLIHTIFMRRLLSVVYM